MASPAQYVVQKSLPWASPAQCHAAPEQVTSPLQPSPAWPSFGLQTYGPVTTHEPFTYPKLGAQAGVPASPVQSEATSHRQFQVPFCVTHTPLPSDKRAQQPVAQSAAWLQLCPHWRLPSASEKQMDPGAQQVVGQARSPGQHCPSTHDSPSPQQAEPHALALAQHDPETQDCPRSQIPFGLSGVQTFELGPLLPPSMGPPGPRPPSPESPEPPSRSPP